MMYSYGGFIGMFLQFLLLLTISYIQLYLAKKQYNVGKENCTYIILLLTNILMFFYNSLNTTNVSWWLLINFIVLLKKPHIRWSIKNK